MSVSRTARIESPRGLPRPAADPLIDPVRTVTATQRQISVPADLPSAGEHSPPEAAGDPPLHVRRVDLSDVAAGEAVRTQLDPVALLAALPRHRRHALWQSPADPADDRAPEALLGIGAALRLVAPRTEEPAAAVATLGAMVRGAFAERIVSHGHGAGDSGDADSWRARGLRAFFTVTFDPTDAFDGAAEATRWLGFSPVEAVVPEILVHCPTEGSKVAEAILVGTDDRLPALAAELEALLAGARCGAAESASLDDGPGDLEIEWAAGRHRRAVEAALEALGDPELSKVVLAHGVEVRRRRPFAPSVLLGNLRRVYPGCFLFSFRPGSSEIGAGDEDAAEPVEKGPTFLGASPERLALVEEASRHGGEGGLRVLSGALAGTAPRGRTPEEERGFGERLLASAKDREEHAIVEEMIAEALAPLCSSLERGGEPALERLDNVQHLYTPVAGALRPGRTLFDAVAALHPTPAVGGMPRDRAMAAIRALEPRPRGLYAGVVGWVDAAGHGDSAVAIRSALVEGGDEGRAVLYAGGGIVPTSDPDVEVEEIRLKLGAVLGAMRAPQDG